MIKKDNKSVMKAVSICFKPFLKPEEAMIYCNLERTRMAMRLQEYGIYKTASGYYRKEDLDRYLSGEPRNNDSNPMLQKKSK